MWVGRGWPHPRLGDDRRLRGRRGDGGGRGRPLGRAAEAPLARPRGRGRLGDRAHVRGHDRGLPRAGRARRGAGAGRRARALRDAPEPRRGRRLGRDPHADGPARRRREAPAPRRRAPGGIAGRSGARRGGVRPRRAAPSATGVSRTVGLGPGEAVRVLRRGAPAAADPAGRGRQSRRDAARDPGAVARVPHGGRGRPSAARDPRAVPRRGRAPGRDSLRARAADSVAADDGARARGARLQVRPARAPPRARPARWATSGCSGAAAAGTRSSACSARRACPRSRSRGSGCRSAWTSAAKTAPEIALAILAEIVASRYGGTGRPLALAKPARPAAAASRRPADRGGGDAGVPRVKAHALVPSDASAERLVGWVLAHDVRDAAGALLGRKGERLDPAGAARLVAGSPRARSTSSRWSPATSTRIRPASGWPAPSRARGSRSGTRRAASGRSSRGSGGSCGWRPRPSPP